MYIVQFLLTGDKITFMAAITSSTTFGSEQFAFNNISINDGSGFGDSQKVVLCYLMAASIGFMFPSAHT